MKRSAALFVLVLATAAPASAGPITVVSASGANAAAIQASVDTFRTQLGANNGVGGSFASGRREINWDGVPTELSAPNNLPANFFNVNSPRGAVFSGGTGFMVSASSADGAVRFDNLNATYSAQFQAFSQQKLFTSLGSHVYDVTFFVPGSTTPAVVRGFGAVFTDVDLANTSSLQVFDLLGNSLQSAFVPTAGGGLSFLGMISTAPEIARVRITLGNDALGPNETNSLDVVVNDDFIYGEPQPVPEPATLFLSAAGLVGLASRRLRSPRPSARTRRDSPTAVGGRLIREWSTR